ncbi:hypothetical protein C7C46_05730 [Streptomyces tateyamensis]|uniref:Uncharacterized protein n=1 Tax=Streptomyces tateyamensis TaxID=565073 RepID=A0A2V4PM51_9ACTN|nr:hypothetical protein [Streptomyces tateyamensis]PYC86609.1 hypothetical protein C7C46_05730 [Streptomyces tateyamensis]
MPQSAIRHNVIALLLDADYTVRPDTNTWSLLNGGRPFTKAEQAAAESVTPQEIEVLVALSNRKVAAELERGDFVEALGAFLMRYWAQLPAGAILGDAVAIMTKDGYDEFEHLLGLVCIDEG